MEEGRRETMIKGPLRRARKSLGRCVRFDRQRHEGAGKEDDARGERLEKLEAKVVSVG